MNQNIKPPVKLIDGDLYIDLVALCESVSWNTNCQGYAEFVEPYRSLS
jgi:hypothetical protein